MKIVRGLQWPLVEYEREILLAAQPPSTYLQVVSCSHVMLEYGLFSSPDNGALERVVADCLWHQTIIAAKPTLLQSLRQARHMECGQETQAAQRTEA